MARDGKIGKVVELLQVGPTTVKTIIEKGGVSKATAYSLPYFLKKKGILIEKGINEAKEITYTITGNATPIKKERKSRKVVQSVALAIA